MASSSLSCLVNLGALAPGASAANGNLGTLSADGEVSLTNADFDIRLGQTANDQLLLAGTDPQTDFFVFSSVSLELTLEPNFVFLPGSTFVIVNGGTDGSESGEFVQGNSITVGADTFAILYNSNAAGTSVGNDVVVQAVPEPDTWTLLVLFATAVSIWRPARASSRIFPHTGT
jgi:hypothetical protein